MVLFTRKLVLLITLMTFSSFAKPNVQYPTDQDIQGIKNVCALGDVQAVEIKVDAALKEWKNLDVGADVSAAKKNLGALLEKVTSDAGGAALLEQYVGCVQNLIEKYLQKAEFDERQREDQNKKYNVVIRSGSSKMYDNSKFGPVDGSISTVTLKIDDRPIARHDLDKPFGSHKVQLTKGDHSFEFDAKIEGSGGLIGLDENCQGTFNVTESGVFEPKLKFEAASQFDGVITDCSLEPAF